MITDETISIARNFHDKIAREIQGSHFLDYNQMARYVGMSLGLISRMLRENAQERFKNEQSTATPESNERPAGKIHSEPGKGENETPERRQGDKICKPSNA